MNLTDQGMKPENKRALPTQVSSAAKPPWQPQHTYVEQQGCQQLPDVINSTFH